MGPVAVDPLDPNRAENSNSEVLVSNEEDDLGELSEFEVSTKCIGLAGAL